MEFEGSFFIILHFEMLVVVYLQVFLELLYYG